MKLFAASLLLVAIQSAHAMTGNDVLSKVLNNPDGSLYIQFYVKGLIDSEPAVRINSRGASQVGGFIRPFCMPAGGTTQQATLIVENHLRRNPENNQLDFYLVARRALLNAWPCTDEQIQSE